MKRVRSLSSKSRAVRRVRMFRTPEMLEPRLLFNSIAGRVYDCNSNAGLGGVSITITGNNGFTDTVTTQSDGSWQDFLPDVALGDGPYTITEGSPAPGYTNDQAFAGTGFEDGNNGTAVNPNIITNVLPGSDADAGVNFNFCENLVQPPESEIRMTGGGSVFLPLPTATNGVVGGPFGADRRITHGFELHCAETGPKGGDITTVNNHLEINWGTPNQHFHLSYLTAIDCPNDPNIDPAPPPSTAGGPDTLIGKGVGTYSGTFNGKKYNKAAATISFILTDAGEPGTLDTASYIITLSTGTIVLNTGDSDGDNVRDASDFNALTTPFTLVPPTSNTDPGSPDIPDQLFLFKGNHQVHLELTKLTTAQATVEKQITQDFNTLDNVNITQPKIDSTIADLTSLFGQYEADGASSTASKLSSTLVSDLQLSSPTTVLS